MLRSNKPGAQRTSGAPNRQLKLTSYTAALSTLEILQLRRLRGSVQLLLVLSLRSIAVNIGNEGVTGSEGVTESEGAHVTVL